jgi:hypothetical protein
MTDHGRDDEAADVPARGNGGPADPEGVYFYGVRRTRGWRGRGGARADGTDDIVRVRYRDIEALTRPVPYVMPPFDHDHVLAHQRTVESAMRRGTVLPAPYGIVFRGRRPLIRMLQEQYLALDEGLSFLEGHWELRLHISPAEGVEDERGLGDLAMDIYSELRRFSRAAVPFPRRGDRLVSAAFLVERHAWIEFMDRAEEIGARHAEFAFDITGPWPAYDFVRVVN